jgi:hypothetical protein
MLAGSPPHEADVHPKLPAIVSLLDVHVDTAELRSRSHVLSARGNGGGRLHSFTHADESPTRSTPQEQVGDCRPPCDVDEQPREVKTAEPALSELANLPYNRTPCLFVCAFLQFLVILFIIYLVAYSRHVGVPDPQDDAMESPVLRTAIGLFFHGWPYAGARECTMASKPCFNRKRCGKARDDFKIALYPKVELRSLEEEGCKTLFWRPIQQEILQLPEYTANADEACIIVPNVDHTIYCSEALWPYKLAHILSSLPTWDEGRNHLLFTQHDDAYLEYDAGYAMVAKVGFSHLHYRPTFDISLMPTSGSIKSSTFNGWELWRDARMQRPLKYLLTFKGAFTWPSRASFAAALHNDNDIIMTTSGNATYNFNELLLNSSFCFAPRGNGHFSHRLHEVMSAGCIPVITGDMYVLPFEHDIDWRAISILVPESEPHSVRSILASISESQRLRMRCRMYLMHTTWLSSVALQVRRVVADLKTRIYGRGMSDVVFWDAAAMDARILHEGSGKAGGPVDEILRICASLMQ